MNNKDRWTNEDEIRLQEMLRRKDEVLEANIRPVIELAEEHLVGLGFAWEIAEALANNADAFRDALEPFDSGERVAEEQVAK